MSKLRSDSTWAGLAAEQRERLEGWLFEEGLGYRETLERAQKDFGVTGTSASLGRFYKRLARERTREDWEQAKDAALSVQEAGLQREELEKTAMAMLAKRVILLATESPGHLKELGALARVLVRSQLAETNRRRLVLEEDAKEKELDEF